MVLLYLLRRSVYISTSVIFVNILISIIWSDNEITADHKLRTFLRVYFPPPFDLDRSNAPAHSPEGYLGVASSVVNILALVLHLVSHVDHN